MVYRVQTLLRQRLELNTDGKAALIRNETK